MSGNPKPSVPSLHSSPDSSALKKDVYSAQNVYGLHNSSLVQDGSLSAPDPLSVPSGQVPHVLVGTKEQLQPTVRTDNMNATSDYSQSLLIRGPGQSFPASSSQSHLRDAPYLQDGMGQASEEMKHPGGTSQITSRGPTIEVSPGVPPVDMTFGNPLQFQGSRNQALLNDLFVGNNPPRDPTPPDFGPVPSG